MTRRQTMTRATKLLLCLAPLATAPLTLRADPARVSANVDALHGFITDLYIDHDVSRAFDTYVAEGLIQHNPATLDGRAAAIALCKPLFTAPHARFEVAHVILDGDLAVIHYRGNANHTGLGAAVTELYRLSGGKLVEHWDAFEPVPPKSANRQPMFGPIAAGVPAIATGASRAERRLVAEFADMFYRQRDVRSAFERFVAPDYVQHNPGVADGRAAAIAALTPLFSRADAHFDIRHILVGGGYAVIHLHAWSGGTDPGSAVFDIYRLDHGRIVEHWDVLHSLPAKPANPRPPV